MYFSTNPAACISLVSTVLYCTTFQAVAYREDGLSLMRNSWKENWNKRNTWWTKKSLPEDDITGSDITQANAALSEIIASLGCYAESCISPFLECCRFGQKTSAFLHCKETQTNCLLNCFKTSKDLPDFNSVIN